MYLGILECDPRRDSEVAGRGKEEIMSRSQGASVQTYNNPVSRISPAQLVARFAKGRETSGYEASGPFNYII